MSSNKASNTEALFAQAVSFHQQQALDKAKLQYEKVLEVDPAYIPALINLGAVFRQLNLIDDARGCYQQAVTQSPQSIEAWFNFGNLSVSIKDWEQAGQCYEEILSRQPNHIPSLYQLALIARENSQWQTCRDTLEKLLRLSPGDANALLELGNALQHLGDRKQALSCYRRLLKNNPDSWKGHYSLARWYDVEGKQSLFNKHLKQALEQAPSRWIVYQNLAQARFDMGNYEGAEALYRQAIDEDASRHSSIIGLGACAMHLGKETEARKYFTSVSNTDDIAILSELARVIWEYKYFDEAIQILRKIVNLRPDLADTHLNLAKAYTQNWNMSQARECLEQVLSIKPGYVEAENLLADNFVKRGLADKALPIYLEQIKREGPLSRSVSSYLFSLLYSDKVSVEEKAAKHLTMMDQWSDALYLKHKFPQTWDANRKIRVGFVSADFRDQHPVGIFIEPLFQYYDKNRFHYSAYYNSRTYDESTLRLKALVDDWRDVAGWSDERLKARILEDRIDILVDLSGQTAKHRLKMFAMRAAPVQFTWLGYPHSTGLSMMDYLIADTVVCPPENDHLCSESVICLANHCVFCFPPTDRYGEVDDNKPAARQQPVFGSFNNLTKVNESTLSLWIDVMKAVPEAKLKLKTPSFTDPECREEFIDYFINAGISDDRLIFTGPSSLEDMMREYAEMDIALDTIPYNGGTTTFQALWMGVPVVTLAGDNFCGRMGASIMHHLGLPEWVAENREGYIEIATRMAGDRKKLLTTKSSLRERMRASPLCDAEGFASEMENIFLKVWQQRCDNHAAM